LLLLLVSTLAGAVAITGALLAVRGQAVRSRAPAWARVYALTLTRHADEALRQAPAIAGVHGARLMRLEEILPERSARDLEGDRLRVIDLEVDPETSGLQHTLATLRSVPGVVEVVDANAAERGRYTRRQGTVLLVAGAALIAIGGAAYALGVSGTAGIAARECRAEITVRHVLGSDPVRLWGPFAITFGGTAALGVATTAGLAIAAAALLREPVLSSLPGDALAWVAAGGAAWLVGTAALTVAATRQAVLRVARTAAAIAAALVALELPQPAHAEVGDELGRVTRELRHVARELAVARHERHRAERRLADAERAMVTGLISADPVVEGLARALRRADASELERWWRRCEHLRGRRDDLRARRHEARLGPPIEPRVVPVVAEVAVPFGPAARTRSAAFRHGVGLRLGGGETIVSTAPGRVAYAGVLAGAGPVVVVDHGRRVYSVYGRIGEPLVALGSKVDSGDPVARAPERPGLLSFSVRQRGRAIDPLRWIESSRSADAGGGTPG
jgi:murein DD-endopeptidase MepM/ murein hydrolase activator NlpD